MITAEVVNTFGKEYLGRSALNDVDEGTFRRMVTRGYPGHGAIVEVGTCGGVGTVLLAQYAEHVLTLDPQDWPHKWDVWDYFGVVDKIDYRQGGVERLRVTDAYTMAFVDGDHSRDAIIRDFEAVRHCGVVLFHDYSDAKTSTCNGAEVRAAVDAIEDGTLHVERPFALWTADK